MAWTTPGTAVAGEVLTAAFWNEQVRDNALFLYDFRNRYVRAKRTAGDLSSSSTTWADVNTALDLVIAASVGDVIEVCVSGLWSNAATDGFLDVVSIVSGSPVNSFGQDGAPDNSAVGFSGWTGGSGVISAISGSVFRTITAGDISGGNVTLRLRRRNASAVTKAIFAVTNVPLECWARNLGPDSG
jgi:hypothetical protein